MTQRIIPITSPRFVDPATLTPAFRPAQLFPRQQPLILEIGCGVGDFFLPLVANHPEQNFLAIDIYNQGCLKTCRRIDEAGLDNARVMRIEARHLIARYLDPWSLAAVYINCPDPWPKKRHRARRLVNAEFLSMLCFALPPGGDLHFATDVADYAEEVAGLITPECGFAALTPLPFALAPPPGYPISKYMRRFLDRGQPIHYLHLRRKSGEIVPPPRPPEISRGYRVRREAVSHD